MDWSPANRFPHRRRPHADFSRVIHSRHESGDFSQRAVYFLQPSHKNSDFNDRVSFVRCGNFFL